MAAGLSNLFSQLGKLGIGLAVVGGVANSALYNVEPGHRAVIFDRFAGVKEFVSGEGTHFMIPVIQRPIIYDCRSKARNVPVITGSKDLQNVSITLRVLFRPVPKELPKIYVNLGEDYDERVLPSITNEVLKAVVAQFDAGELITQREIVSQRVNEELTERAGQFGLILDDISLTHLTFGKEFTEAVEAKQVAQQDAERARYLVEKLIPACWCELLLQCGIYHSIILSLYHSIRQQLVKPLPLAQCLMEFHETWTQGPLGIGPSEMVGNMGSKVTCGP
ncbi:putative prohibitin [Apostichopus japonicus]|uniref:Prohibitin n=1 Tax=Stichopus japonicus TaxID=307972 RepID=A0A2G8LGW6_STIJA|nr:putative prohibitin [Apostichopus japonicus]